MKSIEFTTYSRIQMLSSIDDPDAKPQKFSVPESWAELWIYKNYDHMSIDDFVNSYTWDDTIMMFNDAKDQGVIMHGLFFRGANALNYLFLRKVIGHGDFANDGVIFSEINDFLEDLADEPQVPDSFLKLVEIEMDEGAYLETYSLDEFEERLKNAIQEIMGEVNPTVYIIYSNIAKEICRQREEVAAENGHNAISRLG